MNKLFISGFIADDPQLRQEQGEIPHLVFNLSVRHKTRFGEVRKETYRVSAWHKAAQWGANNLVKGQLVAIQGYLTQRQVVAGNITATTTEIAVDEFLPIQRAVESMQQNGAPAESHSEGERQQGVPPLEEQLTQEPSEDTQPVAPLPLAEEA